MTPDNPNGNEGLDAVDGMLREYATGKQPVPEPVRFHHKQTPSCPPLPSLLSWLDREWEGAPEDVRQHIEGCEFCQRTAFIYFREHEWAFPVLGLLNLAFPSGFSRIFGTSLTRMLGALEAGREQAIAGLRSFVGIDKPAVAFSGPAEMSPLAASIEGAVTREKGTLPEDIAIALQCISQALRGDRHEVDLATKGIRDLETRHIEEKERSVLLAYCYLQHGDRLDRANEEVLRAAGAKN